MTRGWRVVAHGLPDEVSCDTVLTGGGLVASGHHRRLREKKNRVLNHALDTNSRVNFLYSILNTLEQKEKKKLEF